MKDNVITMKREEDGTFTIVCNGRTVKADNQEEALIKICRLSEEARNESKA